ncbi:uncharacterized protein LOC119114654 [Pollicipes pollicipes]|uniref:uncharacterized protein LOC119114654 n=1 Tax=Pollicipes pollicipes TaxID=41117 RepID=UPI001884A173|nr:uncharacterized protein LOC119114654 [Pollicipes pollicipes]
MRCGSWRSLLSQLSFSRGLRLIIFAACLTAFLVLSSVSLTKWVRADVVKSFEVDEKARQTFAVTLCRIQEEIFKSDVYQNITGRRLQHLSDPASLLAAQFPWDGADLEQALWSVTYDWRDLVATCGSFYNQPCAASDVTSALYHYGGQCHTVRFDDEAAEGVQKGLWLSLRKQHCQRCGRHHWNIFVHSAIDHFMDWEHVWAPPKAQLEVGKEQNFKVKRTLEVTLPTASRPCSQDRNYSRPNCMRSCLFRTLGELGPGCRLPWMPLQLPVCGTSEDYQALFNYTRMFSRPHRLARYSDTGTPATDEDQERTIVQELEEA